MVSRHIFNLRTGQNECVKSLQIKGYEQIFGVRVYFFHHLNVFQGIKLGYKASVWGNFGVFSYKAAVYILA